MDLQLATKPSIEEHVGAESSGINITRAIMHYLEPENDNSVLVDNEIELDGSTREFLCRLLEASLASANAYAVDFSGTSTALLVCREMLATVTAFIPRSHELAKSLYHIMAKNKNISSGDLLIIAASDSTGPLLAIFKTDLNREFERKYERSQDGTSHVILIPNDNIIASERRLPQKCAFIRLTRTDFDVQLVDNQISRKEDVAKFFYHDFLGCELLTTPALQTIIFCRAVERWREKHRVYLPQQGIVTFTQALYSQLQSSPLFFQEFAESALLGSNNPELSSSNLAMTLASEVFPKGPYPLPEAFEFDQAVANKLIGSIHLLLEGNIQMSGPSEALISILEKITDQNGNLTFHLVTPWISRKFHKP